MISRKTFKKLITYTVENIFEIATLHHAELAKHHSSQIHWFLLDFGQSRYLKIDQKSWIAWWNVKKWFRFIYYHTVGSKFLDFWKEMFLIIDGYLPHRTPWTKLSSRFLTFFNNSRSMSRQKWLSWYIIP